MPTPRAEIRDTEIGDSPQAFHLAPQPGLRLGVQDVETKLAQALQIRARLQLIQDGKRIQLPHGGFGPLARKCQMKLAVCDRELVIGKAKILFQPLQKIGLKNSTMSVERIA